MSDMLKPSFVAFLDVLGFSALIRDADRNARLEEVAVALKGAASSALEGLRRGHDGFGPPLRVRAFTDNVVAGLEPPDGQAHPEELMLLALYLASYQLSMVLAGFPVRGGVAFGPHFSDDDIVIGPALLDAYKIESDTAVSPRIVLHGSTYAGVDAERMRQTLLDFVARDADGLLFVNYLTALDHRPDFLGVDELRRHRDLVEARLQEFPTGSGIWEKYSWMARYHDFFCGDDEELAEFRIARDYSLRLSPL